MMINNNFIKYNVFLLYKILLIIISFFFCFIYNLIRCRQQALVRNDDVCIVKQRDSKHSPLKLACQKSIIV